MAIILRNTPVLSMKFGIVIAEYVLVALYVVLYEAELYRFCERQNDKRCLKRRIFCEEIPMPVLNVCLFKRKVASPNVGRFSQFSQEIPSSAAECLLV